MSAGREGIFLVVVGVVTLACTHSQTRVGTVDCSRSDDAPALREIDGRRSQLKGVLAQELSSLTGATVRVEGRSSMWNPQQLQVQRYQLLDNGLGVTPYVGQLRWNGTALQLIQGGDQPALRLVGPQAQAIRAQVGVRIWVHGPLVGHDVVEVLGWGIIGMPAQPGKK